MVNVAGIEIFGFRFGACLPHLSADRQRQASPRDIARAVANEIAGRAYQEREPWECAFGAVD
jgi:hypothetical protein